MSLTFNDELHEYRYNGVVVPSVTQILKPLSEYGNIPPQVLQAAADRGTYVHKACEMILWGTLDKDGVGVEYLPYVDAFWRFLSETDFVASLVEQRVYHNTFNYAGTPDIIGTLFGKGALIDIKTTYKVMKSCGPQTMAYKSAYGDEDLKRYTLHLKDDGLYKLIPHDRDREDWCAFVACMTIHNFMRMK